MEITEKDIQEYIELVENIQLESKPTLKMRYLNTANPFSVLALSIYYYGLINKCPSPKWNNTEALPSDVLTAVKTIITSEMYNAKSYYQLPFTVQKVLYYMSDSNALGLQTSHLHSVVNIIPKTDILLQLDITDLPTDNLCPRCEETLDLEDCVVCSNCLDSLWRATEYRVGDFILYGVSRRDFTVKLQAYEIQVEKGKYTFTYTKTNADYPYQGSLPFVEYQDDVSVLM
jgi:hypothetical protein